MRSPKGEAMGSLTLIECVYRGAIFLAIVSRRIEEDYWVQYAGNWVEMGWGLGVSIHLVKFLQDNLH